MKDETRRGYLGIRYNSRPGDALSQMQFEMDLLASGKTPEQVEQIVEAWRQAERCG